MGVKVFRPKDGATCDGWAGYLTGGTSGSPWATVRDGEGTDVSVDETTARVSISKGLVGWTGIVRAGQSFDSASIGNRIVTAAKLRLYVAQKSDVFDQSIRLVAFSPTSAGDIVTDDYALFGTDGLAADIDITDIDEGDWLEIELNEAGIAYINTAGITSLGLRIASDADDNEPGQMSPGTNSVTFRTADHSHEYAPQLVVTYTDGVHATPPVFDGVAFYDTGGGGDSWANVRGAANGTGADSSGETITIRLTGANQFPPGTNKWASLLNGYLGFPTDDIPEDAEILAATLKLFITAKVGQPTDAFAICAVTTDNEIQVETTDYPFTNFGDRVAGDITIAEMTTDLMNAIPLTDFSVIQKGAGAVTKIGIALAVAKDNQEPALSTGYVSLFSFGSGDNADEAKWPILTVLWRGTSPSGGAEELFVLERYQLRGSGIFGLEKRSE